MNHRLFRVQLQNELRKLFARKRTYIGFCVFVVVEILILQLLQLPKAHQALGDLVTNNGLQLADVDSGLTLAAFIIYLTINLLGGLYLALVAGDLVAKEIEDGTLRMVLARPISRTRLFVIKALAGAIHTLALALFIGLRSLAAGAIAHRGFGPLLVFAPLDGVFAYYRSGTGLLHFLCALGFLSMAYQAVSALGLMFSCMRLRPAAATVLTLSVTYVDFVVRSMPYFAAYDSWFFSHHLSCWVRTFQDPVPWFDVGISLLVLGGLSATFWIIGLACFTARDIKN